MIARGDLVGAETERRRRVEELKRAIDGGSYPVDPAALAEALVVKRALDLGHDAGHDEEAEPAPDLD